MIRGSRQTWMDGRSKMDFKDGFQIGFDKRGNLKVKIFVNPSN